MSNEEPSKTDEGKSSLTVGLGVELKLDAYYYSFEKTGVLEIDMILSAVACAGKAFHNTSDWMDKASPYPWHEGECPVDWIQSAANSAAKKFNANNDCHDSDCAIHNAPAYPNGECNCTVSNADITGG